VWPVDRAGGRVDEPAALSVSLLASGSGQNVVHLGLGPYRSFVVQHLVSHVCLQLIWWVVTGSAHGFDVSQPIAVIRPGFFGSFDWALPETTHEAIDRWL